jgi:protein involved in polysaccharide export with SLBB domain
VSGAVTKPGPLEILEPGSRLAKAVDMAGGALKEADLTKVSVVRDDLTRVIVDLSTPERQTDAGHNLLLRNGDSIEVPLLFKGGFVSVSGEVAKAGSYPLVPGMTVEDLIIAAEKMTLVADLERLELVRATGAKETINLPERLQKGASGRVVLAAGDQLIVPRAASMVILVGAVPTPGPRPLKPGQSVRDFFTTGQPETLASLDDDKIDLGSVQLLRPGKAAQKINLKAVLKGEKRAANVTLQTGDVLFLPARREPNKSGLDYLRALPFIGSLVGFF